MDYEKRGYLHDDFKLFHLTDSHRREYEFHYHDFYKILILLSGQVSYTIEGKTYQLAPFDIVFVNAEEIHRPIVQQDGIYERIILYIDPAFLQRYTAASDSLDYCFAKARAEHSNVLRVPGFAQSLLYQKTMQLLASAQDTDYAHALLHQLSFLEFMIQLNRTVLHERIQYVEVRSSNEKILQILAYIKNNLTEEISPDQIADTFYLSKYYLMHLFKAETGYSLGNYITNKRLLYARELLQKSIPATQVCFECGFKNYSTFSRAYKKCFQEIPTKARRHVKSGPHESCPQDG